MFEQLAMAPHTHLTKDKTITAEKSPKAHMILSINKYQLNGFDLLTHITYDLSPQLGGKGGQDAQAMVKAFNFDYSETLYDFHSRSLKFLDKLHILINLRNTMDQIIKFKYKYISHLHNQNNITSSQLWPDTSSMSIISSNIKSSRTASTLVPLSTISMKNSPYQVYHALR
jgi:hypothetical protein